MSLPPLPVSQEAITLCIQLCALYVSTRYMTLVGENNGLAAAFGLLLTCFNLIMVSYSFFMWLKL